MASFTFGKHIVMPALLAISFAAFSCNKSVAPHKPGVTNQMFTEIRSSSGAVIGEMRKLDDFPLYELRYEAEYDPEKAVAAFPPSAALPSAAALPPEAPFACTCFAARNAAGNRILGRNFDWYRHPALVLHMRPNGAYASISLVDISYLGYTSAITPFDAPDRLLDTPYLPFDGMNERGLAIGMMAVQAADSGKDPAKRLVDELVLMRIMLDRAATVNEALAIAGEYNVDFSSVPIHYLVTDSSGASAVIEYVEGRLVVTRPDFDWQVSTNFVLAGITSQTGLCRRYDTAEATLVSAKGRLADPFSLLSNVSQDTTIWSSLYDLGGKTLELAIDRKFAYPFRFALSGEK